MNNGQTDIKQFLEFIEKERGYSLHTIDAYRRDLEKFNSFLTDEIGESFTSYKVVDNYKIKDFNKIILKFFNKEIIKERSSKTRARRLSTIKAFFNYLVQTEVICDNPAIHINTPKVEKKIPTFVQENKIEDLMKMPNAVTLIGKRDRAILELFYATGIRLNELAGLNIGSVNPKEKLLRVLGKGNKERIVPFGKSAKNALESYLKKRGKSWASSQETPLFTSRGDKRIAVRTIQQRVNIYLKEIMGKTGASPHTLRHTFGTHLLDNDADIRSIQELLGHSNISSTQIYTKVNPKKMKDIYTDAHPHG